VYLSQFSGLGLMQFRDIVDHDGAFPIDQGTCGNPFSRVVLRPMQQISHSQGCPETESGGNRLASSTLAY
jgi:hypothetical protein